MLTWLNASAVKKALNVPPDAYLFLTDNGVGFNYSLTEKNLMPFYHQVAATTDLKTHAIDRLHHAAAHRELGAQAPDLQDGIAHRLRLGLST